MLTLTLKSALIRSSLEGSATKDWQKYNLLRIKELIYFSGEVVPNK